MDIALEQLPGQLDRYAGVGVTVDGTKVWDSRIRQSIVPGRSVLRGLPVCRMPRSEGAGEIAGDYRQVAGELLRRLPQSG